MKLMYVIIYSYYDSHLSQTHYMHIHKTTILKFNHKFNHISISPVSIKLILFTNIERLNRCTRTPNTKMRHSVNQGIFGY